MREGKILVENVPLSAENKSPPLVRSGLKGGFDTDYALAGVITRSRRTRLVGLLGVVNSS